MHERAQQSSVPTPAWSVVILIAGFFLGIPAALILEPRLAPFFSDWLNPLRVSVAVALATGVTFGASALLLLSLMEAIGPLKFQMGDKTSR